jgi:hypothetical protein
MFNTIGSLSRLSSVLCQFDPHAVNRTYGEDWERLLLQIKTSGLGQIDPRNARGYWVHFAKGSLDGARFLSTFPDAQHFAAFVGDFYGKATTRPALPMLLAHEIHGFGFALACDFLKGIGFTQYAKPDVHVIDTFVGLGFARDSPLDVYRAVCRFAEEVGETPYAVDKAFWLIGSGNLHLEGRRFQTNRAIFISSVKASWSDPNEPSRLK